MPLIIFGLNHLMNANGMAGAVLQGWPFAVALVYISGLALILAGIAIIINKYARVASLLLALLMLIFILTLHFPGLGIESTKMMAMVNLLKDAAIMGAALTYAGILK
ncbi:MAG: DoxX family membrane protein [Bacteroidales bacterium]|nr:DoxX family membrane protein [Bacteroidales bacterium]